MSLPVSIKTICANCHHEAEYMDWASTYSFGSPDLDTRPPEDYRFALNQILVKKCDNCGYCNTKIEEGLDNLNEIISSDVYQKQIGNIQFPEKANQFLCKSIILEKVLDLENSAWASLHAAWNCDDNEKYVQSKYCRNRALHLFTLANATSALNFEKDGEFPVLLVDLYRRTEQFDTALKICEVRINREEDELLKKVLLFQKHLCSMEDIKMYKIQNAIEYYDEHIDEFEDTYEDDDYENDDYEYSDNNYDNDYDRDYFDAMTDGQLGDYDDFIERGGNMDDIDTWSRG